jgi:hypothetical protein
LARLKASLATLSPAQNGVLALRALALFNPGLASKTGNVKPVLKVKHSLPLMMIGPVTRSETSVILGGMPAR